MARRGWRDGKSHRVSTKVATAGARPDKLALGASFGVTLPGLPRVRLVSLKVPFAAFDNHDHPG